MWKDETEVDFRFMGPKQGFASSVFQKYLGICGSYKKLYTT